MAFTRSTVSTTNISDLPNQPLISATALKAKFDKYGADDKPYINDTLLPELESTANGNSGAGNIGSATITGVTGNTIWAQLSNIASQLLNNYLSKTNSVAYTPTQPYHPATKKYSDDGIAGAVIGQLPLGSVTAPYIATDAVETDKIKDDAVTQDKIADNAVGSSQIASGAVDYAELSSGIQGRFEMTDKAIAELLMLADIDSKVFSPNLGKFYTKFSTVMDYSLGSVDATKQNYTGTLSAGASSVTVASSTGFSAGQEVSVQDGTNYEDVVLLSVVGNTLNFKTNLVNSYTSPSIYRSNNNGTEFGNVGVNPENSTFGLHFDNSMNDFVGNLVPSLSSGTFDTTNKVFGTASRAYNGSQVDQWDDNSAFEFGSNDFVIYMRAKVNTTGTLCQFCGKNPSSVTAPTSAFYVQRNADNTVSLFLSNGTSIIECKSPAVANTNFNEYRFGRVGNMIYASANGVVGTGVSFTGTVPNISNKFSIAQAGENTTNRLNGNVDEFLIRIGTSMNSTNYTPETSAFGAAIPVTKNVLRVNISPYEPVKYISAWLTKSKLAGFTADGKVSIVANVADESYVDLTETTTDIGATNEVIMIGDVPTANSKVTLKIELNRASTSDSVSFTKLVGGVSA